MRRWYINTPKYKNPWRKKKHRGTHQKLPQREPQGLLSEKAALEAHQTEKNPP